MLLSFALPEIFVIGTLWFWILCAVEFGILVFFISKNDGLSAFFSFVASLLLVGFLGSGLYEVGQWIINNPLYTILAVISYIVFGTLYVITPYIGKWWWFVRDIRDYNREAKAHWLNKWQRHVEDQDRYIADINHRLQTAHPSKVNDYQLDIEKYTIAKNFWENSKGVMTEQLFPLWKEYEKTVYRTDFFGRSIPIVKPTPTNFKAQILTWITWWPPSLCWTLINDPLRRIGTIIYENVSGFLENVANKAWADEDKI